MQADDDQAVARAEESRGTQAAHVSGRGWRSAGSWPPMIEPSSCMSGRPSYGSSWVIRIGAAAAGEHARHARKQLALALREQQDQEGETPAGGHQMAVAL
jgi:hypothetical protein